MDIWAEQIRLGRLFKNEKYTKLGAVGEFRENYEKQWG